MSNPETIANIVAEMRGLVKPGETLNHTYELLNGLADRIEAAHKREVATAENSSAVGNGAKMLSALKAIFKGYEVWDVCDYIGWGEERCKGCPQEALCKAIFNCKNALAEPRRNCDVGTVDEQTERFVNFARLYFQSEVVRFVINWSQMPYEEEKGSKV